MKSLSAYSLQADIILKYLTGSSSNLVGSGDPCPPLLASLNTFVNQVPLMKQFPLLPVIALQLPSFLSGKVAPGYVQFRKVSICKIFHVTHGPLLCLVLMQ